MINKGDSLESLATRSFGAATGTRTRMPVCSRSTGTTRATSGTTSASADPRKQNPDGRCAAEGHNLGRESPAASAAKAWQQAQSETATGAAAAVAGFDNLIALDNLHTCWWKARKNKGKRQRIQQFANDALNYLKTIHDRLAAGTFTFGPYQVFTVRDKKWRDVIDAPMKDRVVHWMIYRVLLPLWLPRFIADTFGNLPNKGSHAAVERLADFARKPSNTWVLQMDISKYFYAVRHDLLKERVLRYIGNYRLRLLLINLIDSFQTGDMYDDLFPAGSTYRETAQKGMPIGNLPSQLFANIYLCEFDHWVKEVLGVRCYIRYVDDLVILGSSKDELQRISDQIVSKLSAEGLTINPRKLRIAPTKAGIPFLGYVVWENHISAGARIRRRFHHRLRQHEAGYRDRTESVRSYLAALGHTGQTRMRVA